MDIRVMQYFVTVAKEENEYAIHYASWEDGLECKAQIVGTCGYSAQ